MIRLDRILPIGTATMEEKWIPDPPSNPEMEAIFGREEWVRMCDRFLLYVTQDALKKVLQHKYA